MVQDAPTATVLPQVVVWANWFVVPPDRLILVTGNANVPVLVNVIARGALAVPKADLEIRRMSGRD